ncbi:U3 small nucleolar ribonucleoprotein protein MPP10 [Pectinophora gossypiella]|uniref:U3 small nucleolar ribonucleoprotein protein MPP10 n=1 Tax=Pectinophora gossypiella TaxID=13191 RepID=UPI00214F2373|nr:U3 small nucleolar ribonucleoprotein protein MPP10 [Pectinophora gossypiella]
MTSVEVENIIDKFQVLTQKPVKFLSVQEDVKDDIKNLVKSLYDYTKSQESGAKKEKKSALPELIIEDFDEEQIWQQIELQNSECWDHLVWEVANCMSAKDTLKFSVEVSQKQTEESDVEDEEMDDEEMSEASNNEEEMPKKKKDKKVKAKPSIVDDKFFKLQEMEKFLLNEEKNEGKHDSDEESVDLFEEVDSEEDEEGGGKEMMYDDFFNQEDDGIYEQQNDENYDQENDEKSDESPDEDQQEIVEQPKKKGKKVTFADQSSDETSDDKDSEEETNNIVNKKQTKQEKKSEFEMRQERLQQTINRLEQKTLNEAPWQLKGEVDATKRPQNSLLQEVVDFDLTSRPAPIITEQTTITLEDIIRQRIKDKAWDDVIRKEKPVDDQLSFRKQEILDQSKSKQSLAEVYEAEYLKQKQALSGEVEEEKEPESHTQIREAMAKLFSKLDALSHYHYTPKPPQAEVKIVSNTPAISMEEVAPVATSEAALLAPEEVKKKCRGDLMSKEERTQTDKNRERRKKKQQQRKKGQVSKVTEHRNTSKAVEANDKSLKTSKAFFQQLNDDSTSLIKKKNKPNIKNKGQ